MRTIGYIQVRLNSTRLPRKALEPIGGIPSFAHVYHRVAHVKPFTVVACPERDFDELSKWLPNGAVTTVPCDEDDRLERTYLTAKMFDADVVIRITGDCIFTCPNEITRCVEEFHRRKVPYYENTPHELAYHGLECQVFSMPMLAETYHKATSDPDREHTIPYMRRECGYGESEGPNSTIYRAKRRAVLDTYEDLAWFRTVAETAIVTPPFPSATYLTHAMDTGFIPTIENEVTHNA